MADAKLLDINETHLFYGCMFLFSFPQPQTAVTGFSDPEFWFLFFFLSKLIQFSENRTLPIYSGVVYAFLLLVASVVKCLVFHHMIIIQDKQGQ